MSTVHHFCGIIFLSIFFSCVGMENERETKQISTAAYLENNTFEAITFCTELEPYSEDFCNHVIATAPVSVKKKFKLLVDPDLREQVLPGNNIMIFYGPPGSGKSTLTRVIAQKMKMPFFIVKGGMLANEYANSAAAGLKRVQQIIKKKKGIVIIDEFDCLTKKEKKKDDITYQDNTPKALGELLDEIENNNLLFMASLNEISDIPEPLQNRIAGNLYQVPYTDQSDFRHDVLAYLLKQKNVESRPETLKKLAKITAGLSNREMKRMIHLALEQALEKNPSCPYLILDEFKGAIKKIKEDTKTLSYKKWEKKDIFNYSIQTIAAIANIVNITSSILSLKNNMRSIKIAELGLLFQEKNLEMQNASFENQKHGLELQEEGLECQKRALDFQYKGLELQTEGIDLQHKSHEIQQKGFNLQEDTYYYQMKSNWAGFRQYVGAQLLVVLPYRGLTWCGKKCMGLVWNQYNK